MFRACTSVPDMYLKPLLLKDPWKVAIVDGRRGRRWLASEKTVFDGQYGVVLESFPVCWG